jgi:hypothetical protein
VAPLPAAFGDSCASSRLTLQLVVLAQPHGGAHLAGWGSALLARTTKSHSARRRLNLTFCHQVLGVELHQQGMDAELLHPRRHSDHQVIVAVGVSNQPP